MPLKIARFMLSLIMLMCAFFVHAQIQLPALISDNMVLQQRSTVKLWGRAAPGEDISIDASWTKNRTHVQADGNGQWVISIKTTAAGGPYEIRFSASNIVTVHNVYLGEVWLASGQSNMEFFMGKVSNPSYNGVIDYEKEIAAADHPLIRMIDVANKVADLPQNDFSGKWKICSPQTADTFSAVAYYFARAIQSATGFPVGIINATLGGTPAESWMRQDILERDSSFHFILDRYRQQCEIFPTAIQQYRADLAAWKADTAATRPAAPREPLGPSSSKSPYKLYNGMIAPLLNYSLRGVIWYQGENNADRAFQYRRLFPALIDNWRNDFHLPEMPFYFVQIAPHRSQHPEIRDAQLNTLKTVPHTGMAVITDNGDSLNIHPRNKQPVGERLARWALKNEYGQKNIIVSGPIYRSMKVEGNKIRLYFDYADSLYQQGEALREFSIASNGGPFMEARAVIDGSGILVWNDAIANPTDVRFAWRNIPRPNLYNKAGLPASPFRTDHRKQDTEGKN